MITIILLSQSIIVILKLIITNYINDTIELLFINVIRFLDYNQKHTTYFISALYVTTQYIERIFIIY